MDLMAILPVILLFVALFVLGGAGAVYYNFVLLPKHEAAQAAKRDAEQAQAQAQPNRETFAETQTTTGD